MPIMQIDELNAIARKTYLEELSQARFDVLIKMAEGCHVLADKGCPGTLEFTTDILKLMGEHFPTSKTRRERIHRNVQSILQTLPANIPSETRHQLGKEISDLIQKIEYPSEKSTLLEDFEKRVRFHIPSGDYRSLIPLFSKLNSLVHIETELNRLKLLKMQSLFFKSLKDKDFLEKKKTQFTKRANIHIEKSIFPTTPEAEAVANALQNSKDANIESLMGEAYAADVEARYDGILKKFDKDIFTRILTDEDYAGKLDASMLAFFSSIKHAQYTLNNSALFPKLLEMVNAFLWKEDKTTLDKANFMTKLLQPKLRQIIQQSIKVPISDEIKTLTELRKIIQKSPPAIFMLDLHVNNKPLLEGDKDSVNIYGNFLNVFNIFSTSLNKLKSFLESSGENLNPLQVQKFIHTLKESLLEMTFLILKRTRHNIDLAIKSGLATSSVWKKHLEALDSLLSSYSDILENQKVLLMKKESGISKSELEKDLKLLNEAQNSLYKKAINELRNLTTFSQQNKSPELINLLSLTRFVMSGIDDLDYSISIIEKGYKAFRLESRSYQEAFSVLHQKNLPPQTASLSAELLKSAKSHFSDILNKNLNKTLEQLARNQMSQKFILLDKFCQKYEKEISHLPTSLIEIKKTSIDVQKLLVLNNICENSLNAIKNAIQTSIENRSNELIQLQALSEAKRQNRGAASFFFSVIERFSPTSDSQKIQLLTNEIASLKDIESQFQKFSNSMLNIDSDDPNFSLDESLTHLYKEYETLKNYLFNMPTLDDISDLQRKAYDAYHAKANLFIENFAIRFLHQPLEQVASETRSLKQSVHLINLHKKAKSLEVFLIKIQITNETVTNLAKTIEIRLSKNCHQITSGLLPNTLNKQDRTHALNKLENAKKILGELKRVEKKLKTSALTHHQNKLRDKLYEIETGEQKLHQQLPKFLLKYASKKNNSTIKVLFQKNLHANKVQLLIRGNDLEFLQKIIDLLNVNTPPLLDSTQVAIVGGALDHFNQFLQITKTTVGVHKFKGLLNEIQKDLSLMDTYIPSKSKNLEAFHRFIQQHANEFEGFNLASIVLTEKRSLKFYP